MEYTAEQLSNTSIEELEQMYKAMKKPAQEQKEIAWKKMDIGIYDNNGYLIGDKQMHEDGYDD